MKFLLTGFFIILSIYNSEAQQEQLQLADTLFSRKAYYKAAEMYKKTMAGTDSVTKCRIWRNIAYCYSRLNNPESAEAVYRQLLNTCNSDTKDLRELAKILQRTGDYEKAKKLYASCYASERTDSFSFESMAYCDTITKSLDKISEVYLENLNNINSAYDDILDDAVNDTIVFLSARKAKKSEVRLFSNNQYAYKRYRSHMTSRITEKEALSGYIFTAGGSEATDKYVSLSIPDSGSKYKRRTVIYRLRSKENNQAEEQIFAFDDGSSMYGHPNISVNGTMFFFVSDMPGGYGGTDIYLCKKNGTKWSHPVNLGKEINTEGNELFPFYLGEGLLLFNSDGRPGYGGFDVYSSMFQNNKWKKAVNLGPPVNSRANDLAMRWDRVKKSFYISSDRAQGKGALDIYRIHQFSSSNVRKVF